MAMASKRNTASKLQIPEHLSREELAAALQDMAAHGVLKIKAANDIFEQRALTKQEAIKAATPESRDEL